MTMKTYLAVCVLLWAFAGVKCYMDYPEGVAELREKTTITTSIVEQMTQEIFQAQPVNCGVTMTAPTTTNLPMPSDDCDKAGLHLLRKAFREPNKFDYKSFLKTFWCSDVGSSLVNVFSKKNVSFDLLEKAMIDTWFKGCNEKNMPFLRIIVKSGKNPTEYANSWYTYAVRSEGKTDCEVVQEGSSIPLIVKAKCKGDQYFYSTFIYTNTPYEDLIIYTLCSWANYRNTEQCLVHVSGGTKKFHISTAWALDGQGNYCLNEASPRMEQ